MLPTCEDCGHPAAWHGDRAVCPCDGNWSPHDPHSMYRYGAERPVCSCLGYRTA